VIYRHLLTNLSEDIRRNHPEFWEAMYQRLYVGGYEYMDVGINHEDDDLAEGRLEYPKQCTGQTPFVAVHAVRIGNHESKLNFGAGRLAKGRNCSVLVAMGVGGGPNAVQHSRRVE